MKNITLSSPGGLERLKLNNSAEPGAPGPGQIRVRIHACSLNYHDYAVVVGAIPTEDQRIPMADGAGVVEAIGGGVSEFEVGDHVVSTFFPEWLTGPAPIDHFSTTPGDGQDGYAREQVVRPANWFTHAPKGYTHAEAATLTTAGLTAWRALVVNGGLKSRRYRAHAGYRWGVCVCTAVRQDDGRAGYFHLVFRRKTGTAYSIGCRPHHQL